MARLQTFAAAAAALFAAEAASALEIGVASSVRNEVRGDLLGELRDLGSGDGVSADELITTGADSGTQLLFVDSTSVTLGPDAALTLNRFVYDPNQGAGDVVVGAAKGAFRFVSGLAGPDGYSIETPRATVGIRGSIVEGYVDAITGEEAIILLQGVVEICPRNAASAAECEVLSKPGAYIYIDADGDLIGPRIWRGPFLTQDAEVDFVEFVREQSRDPDPMRRTERASPGGGMFFFEP